MGLIIEKIISQEEFDIKVYEACHALYSCGINPEYYRKWIKEHEDWMNIQQMKEIKLSREIG